MYRAFRRDLTHHHAAGTSRSDNHVSPEGLTQIYAGYTVMQDLTPRSRVLSGPERSDATLATRKRLPLRSA